MDKSFNYKVAESMTTAADDDVFGCFTLEICIEM